MNYLKKLIIYNEISGKGNASKVCYNLLLPNIRHNIVQIYPCYEYSFINPSPMIRNDFKNMLNKNNYDVIIILGGDGTVHSLINNLVELDLTNKPICHIPCGTGNGLSKSVYYSKFKDYTPFNIKNVINNICEYETCKVNIFRIKSIGDHNYIEKYGFLSLTWGIFSEIDIKIRMDETNWFIS